MLVWEQAEIKGDGRTDCLPIGAEVYRSGKRWCVRIHLRDGPGEAWEHPQDFRTKKEAREAAAAMCLALCTKFAGLAARIRP